MRKRMIILVVIALLVFSMSGTVWADENKQDSKVNIKKEEVTLRKSIVPVAKLIIRIIYIGSTAGHEPIIPESAVYNAYAINDVDKRILGSKK